MTRRGNELRERILYAAKDVFLDVGFERASMDVIAGRAETTKRTLYSHFENKEKLYLAVVALVRQLFLGLLRTPGEYSEDTAEALTLFCGQFLLVLKYGPAIRMCRLSIAEAERFPEGAAQHFDVLFSTPHERLSVYLVEKFGVSEAAGAKAAQGLLGQLMYPIFPRALFGLEPLSDDLEEDIVRDNSDLTPVRKAVTELIESLTP